jgi:hypothetical protein
MLAKSLRQSFLRITEYTGSRTLALPQDPSATTSLEYRMASTTMSALHQESYARKSSLPSPEKAQPHCVRPPIKKGEGLCSEVFSQVYFYLSAQ